MGLPEVRLAALLVVGCLGCRAEFQVGPAPQRGVSPQANAGTGTTLRLDEELVLDGSGSIDPDGSIAEYHWNIVSAPQESVAAILDDAAAVTAFTADVPGAFAFELQVIDDDGNGDWSRVDFVVSTPPLTLTVNAGADIITEWRKSVQLTGMYAVVDPETPTLAWTLVSKPARSTATLQNPTTLTPTFVADADGTYVLALTASTLQYTDVDMVMVVATAPRTVFNGTIIDIEIAEQHLIVTSDSPPRLRFIDAAIGTETSIPLPSTPIALSMDQYANSVAVATAGQVTIVDVFSKTVTGSFTVPFAISHLVVGPFQLVHCFTPQAGPIHTIDLTTGIVTPSANSVSAGSVGKLHLHNNEIYVLEPNGVPPDLANYYAGSAPLELVRDSPYAGEYPLGGDLWIFYDTIAVAGGGLFDSGTNALDMLYRGRLNGDEPAVPQFVTRGGPKIYSLHALSSNPPSGQLRIYDPDSLALLQSLPLPDLIVNGTPQRSTGRILGFTLNLPDKLVIVASAGSSNAIFVTDL